MKPITNSLIVMLILSVSAAASDSSEGWTDKTEVKLRRDAVVWYRAKLDGDLLVVEVTHAKGWHTYSMDNIERAREVTAKESPETELPTRIEVTGGLEVAGPWKQTPPKDLSDPTIKWYTWGYEGPAYFAAPVKRTEGQSAAITVNAQACNASSCAMVDNIKLELALPDTLDKSTSTPNDLIPLKPKSPPPQTE